MDILNLKMLENDASAETIGDYLRALLQALWQKDEGFSGKRPFGNSGWKYDVYVTLIKAGVVAGKLDSDGYVAEVAEAEADALVEKAILSLH